MWCLAQSGYVCDRSQQLKGGGVEGCRHVRADKLVSLNLLCFGAETADVRSPDVL